MRDADEQLPDEVQQAVDLIVGRNLTAVRAALADVELPAPAYAVGIWPGDDGDDMEAAALCVGLEPDRVRAIETLSEYDAYRAAWAVSDFAISPVTPMASIDPAPDFEAAVEVVVEYAADVGEDVPYRVALNRLARLLTEQPPVTPSTDDFVGFLFSEGFAEELIANLEFSATAAVAEKLRTKRLLPKRWEELEGAPRFFE